MSGVTPILDTLLHQVLGRRANFLRQALLDQPIPPAQAGQASHKLHSDSRLGARPALDTAPTRIVTGAKVPGAESSAARAARNPAAATGAGNRLSEAGRVIADILARYPSAPSALRPTTPLLPAGAGVQVAALAAKLRESVEHSGLFYESHLLRWHQGGYPLARLAREPQMRWQATWSRKASVPADASAPQASARSMAKASSGVATNGPGAGPAATSAPASPSGLWSPGFYAPDGKPLPAGSGVPTAMASGSGDASAAIAPLAAGHAGLESTVRHQLEMLATPVLRWEGQPWAGVFMAMVLQPPPQQAAWQQASGDDASAAQEEDGWSSRLVLRMSRLGEVGVALQLAPGRVRLDMEAGKDTAARLKAGAGRLQERLGALGFRDIRLNVRARPGDEENGH